MIRLNKAAAQAGVMHQALDQTVIGRAEMIENTTGSLITKIARLNLVNVAAQWIVGHG